MNKIGRTPLYQILIDDLKKQIDDGLYQIGDFLPSENELCKQYNTTRPTVRQALATLANANYIIRKHGKGSIVTEPKNGLGILSVKGVTAGVGQKKLKTYILKKPHKSSWPDDFPFKLNDHEKKLGCIYFTRLRHINDLPILYEETYIGNKNLPRFIMRNLEKNSLFDTLRKNYQVEIKEGEQKIWAIEASIKMEKLLKTKVNSPLLHMKRKLITNIPDLNIYSFLYCNTEDYFIQDYF